MSDVKQKKNKSDDVQYWKDLYENTHNTLQEMMRIHDLQMKSNAVYTFDWEIDDDISREERIRIFNNAFLLDGFKEMLSKNLYHYRKKFLESREPEKDIKSFYWAEVYQDILHKMKASHDLTVDQSVKKQVVDNKPLSV